jgi:hypothetical protein
VALIEPNLVTTADILDAARIKRQVAELGRRQQERAEEISRQRPILSDEEIANERFQAESNALAEANPLYAAARSASAAFLVVPLAPGSTEPLVDPREASNVPRTLFEWWTRHEGANPGLLLGRVGGALALKVDDMAAYGRLREMATVEYHDEDDRTWKEYREIGGYSLRLVRPSQPVRMRSIQGWGKAYARALTERERELRAKRPEAFYLAWSYPSVISGLDAHDFRSRKLGPGLTVLGEGDVLPADGAIVSGFKVVGPTSRPPEIPQWLAATIGRPRSRKAMQAAREAYEALLRRDEAHVIARIAATRAYEEEAREQAIKDREQAERVLADEMAKG